jgi:eukaryotic-like serine/threonine-protein kinase
MEPVNTTCCRQCGNKLPEDSSQDGLCQQCRSISPTDGTLPTADEASKRTLDAVSPRVLPDRIGPYKILDFLGEGGMGVVYLAEQEQPIRRKVALKVIKLGMDTKEVIARFESERQALAMMNHPNIAQVHDAGTTERGAPYFVMEHVAGIPITDYCDKHRLSTRERLEIFIPVCQAIQHAHQKGIIHRDIKPSNVLVAMQDGKPVPKIIDFGVAKATNQRLTEKTVFTQQGLLIGTPEYMSPEQAEMTGLDVDTTTDIYSLGVLLYQLLVGALPFDAGTLRRAGYDEIRRRIREEEPPKPTTRLSSLGQLAKEIAERRRTDVASLTKDLRGDLEWVTMKAMEKDRTRRYSTSSELAADIERHLKHEPVIACPPSSAYRVGKFVRRHRMGVGIVAASVLVLIAFAVTTATQARRIARERDRAERVSAFLVSMFESSDPDKTKGEKVTARELLDKGVERLGVELKNEPETRAALLHSIGRVYDRLGNYVVAERLLGQALAVRRNSSGRNRLDLADTLNELGNVHATRGDYPRAEAEYREALEIRHRILGRDSLDAGKSLNQIANMLLRRGRYSEAEATYREVLSITRPLGTPADVVTPLLNLGAVYTRQGKLNAAIDAFREGFELAQRSLGRENTLTLSAMNNLANALYYTGEYAEAEQLQRENLTTRRKLLGDNHFDVGLSLYNLGNTLEARGRFAQAEKVFLECLAVWRKALPSEHVQIAWALNDLAIVITDQGRCGEAETLFREALAMFERVSPDPASVAYSWEGLGDVSYRRGQMSEAEKYYCTALDLMKKKLGATHISVARTENKLGRLLIERGRYEEAEPMLRDALQINREGLPATHPSVGYAEALLGSCLGGQRRFHEAEQLLLKGYETLRAKLGEEREDTNYIATRLAALYEAWGKPQKAAEWRASKLPPSK